jgi:hypothetical protein
MLELNVPQLSVVSIVAFDITVASDGLSGEEGLRLERSSMLLILILPRLKEDCSLPSGNDELYFICAGGDASVELTLLWEIKAPALNGVASDP